MPNISAACKMQQGPYLINEFGFQLLWHPNEAVYVRSASWCRGSIKIVKTNNQDFVG